MSSGGRRGGGVVGGTTTSASIQTLLSKVQRNLNRISTLQDARTQRDTGNIAKMRHLASQPREPTQEELARPNSSPGAAYRSQSLPGALQQPTSASSLVERLVKTEKALDQVVGMFKEFQQQSEKDKDAFEHRIQLLEHRLQQKGVDLNTERKLEQMDRAIASRLQSLESRQRQDTMQALDVEADARTLSKLSSDIRSIGQGCQRDVDHITQEFAALKGVVLRLQGELSSTGLDAQEALRANTQLQRQVSTQEQDVRSLASQHRQLDDKLVHMADYMEWLSVNGGAQQTGTAKTSAAGRTHTRSSPSHPRGRSRKYHTSRARAPTDDSSESDRDSLARQWRMHASSRMQQQHPQQHAQQQQQEEGGKPPRRSALSAAQFLSNGGVGGRTAGGRWGGEEWLEDEDAMSKLSLDSLSNLSESPTNGVSQSTIDRMRESFLRSKQHAGDASFALSQEGSFHSSNSNGNSSSSQATDSMVGLREVRLRPDSDPQQRYHGQQHHHQHSQHAHGGAGRAGAPPHAHLLNGTGTRVTGASGGGRVGKGGSSSLARNRDGVDLSHLHLQDIGATMYEPIDESVELAAAGANHNSGSVGRRQRGESLAGGTTDGKEGGNGAGTGGDDYDDDDDDVVDDVDGREGDGRFAFAGLGSGAETVNTSTPNTKHAGDGHVAGDSGGSRGSRSRGPGQTGDVDADAGAGTVRSGAARTLRYGGEQSRNEQAQGPLGHGPSPRELSMSLDRIRAMMNAQEEVQQQHGRRRGDSTGSSLQ